jgi:phosphoserine phosphatase
MTIKLVVFDVDGTLFQTHSWQYIHENLGTWPQAQENKKQFFAGRITYEDWAQLDASLWRNQPISRLNQIVSQMRYVRGAEETLATLNRRGFLLYLLSAGLSLVGERVQRETHVDGYLANSLGVRDGFLTGDVQVNVSFHQKGKILNSILRKFNLTQQDCAAVGDDPTLVPLFKKVALGIAFNPTSEEVEKQADIIVKNNDLRNVLPYILKYPKA